MSLINGGVATLNAAGFLLMAAGPTLLDYIVISTIFSLGSWTYSWILPAAVSYRQDLMPQLRLLQLLTIIAASTVMLVTHPGLMSLLFIAMMIIDVSVFPQHILLFRSDTRTYLRMELVRGIANSIALVAVLLFLNRDPLQYVELLLINLLVSAACLAAAGTHRPPSLRLARPGNAYRHFRTQLFSRQLATLLSAKGIESGTMIALSHLQMLAPALSLKIGLAVASALSANARQHSLPTLWLVHLLIYGSGTVAIVLLGRVALPGIALPETLRLVTLANAVYVLPMIMAIFTLTVLGLRLSDDRTGRIVESQADI
jgi:hypothetical protein